ncbi:MAG: hypothetical protein ACLFR0_06885 [Alphaproteobacteria bacterium]
MRDNNQDQPQFSWKTMAYAFLGLYTAGEAAGFANSISQGYVDAALLHGALAGGMLYLSHGSHDYLQDDEHASGLKNHFMGYAVGSILAVTSPNPYAENAEEGQNIKQSFLEVPAHQMHEEEPRYPALENLSFG